MNEKIGRGTHEKADDRCSAFVRYRQKKLLDASRLYERHRGSRDGLVESVVMPNRSFVLAVQWHPEYSCNVDDYSQTLFAAFVNASESPPYTIHIEDITA